MLEVIIAFSCVQDSQDRGRFFGRREVDFWNEKKPSRRSVTSLWAEPVVGVDGRVRVHVPQPEVVEFLESPTREGAERYLAWQRERTERMRRAMEALAEVQSAKEGPFLYYFSRPGCPYCADQDKVLAGSALRVVRPPQDSPLWSRYGVRIVPTLVLVRPSQPPRVFEGFTPRAAIEKEASRVDR